MKVLFNKNVLSGRYSLNVPALMPLIQQLVSTKEITRIKNKCDRLTFFVFFTVWVGLVALSSSGTIKKLPTITVNTLSHMLPVSVSFLAYLLLGMMALVSRKKNNQTAPIFILYSNIARCFYSNVCIIASFHRRFCHVFR